MRRIKISAYLFISFQFNTKLQEGYQLAIMKRQTRRKIRG